MRAAMSTHEAERVLELPPLYDEAAVRFCYGRAMRADHPDHGGLGTRLELIREARDVLLCGGATGGVEITPCKLCKGRGKIVARFGVRACSACKGTGDQL
jgi:hypothetical protein